MARKQDVRASRCMNAGIAVGALACALDALQKEVEFAQSPSFHEVHGLVRNSVDHAKLLKKSLPTGSKSEAIQIYETLRLLDKDMHREQKRSYRNLKKGISDFPYLPASIKEKVSALKNGTRKALVDGIGACGKQGPRYSRVSDLLMDSRKLPEPPAPAPSEAPAVQVAGRRPGR